MAKRNYNHIKKFKKLHSNEEKDDEPSGDWDWDWDLDLEESAKGLIILLVFINIRSIFSDIQSAFLVSN